jgi:hypothetical protein
MAGTRGNQIQIVSSVAHYPSHGEMDQDGKVWQPAMDQVSLSLCSIFMSPRMTNVSIMKSHCISNEFGSFFLRSDSIAHLRGLSLYLPRSDDSDHFSGQENIIELS